jgi:hypothetical protein
MSSTHTAKDFSAATTREACTHLRRQMQAFEYQNLEEAYFHARISQVFNILIMKSLMYEI